MSASGVQDRHRYRNKVDGLLAQIEQLRHRRQLLDAAGVYGDSVAAVEAELERRRRQLAATVETRVHSPA